MEKPRINRTVYPDQPAENFEQWREYITTLALAIKSKDLAQQGIDNLNEWERIERESKEL
jgi:hypothetical protein